MIEHYENKITELEMLVRKLDLHNKVLKKDLEYRHDEEKPLKTNSHETMMSVRGRPVLSDAKLMPPKESMHKSASSLLRSQKQQDQKAKLLEQRNTISQTIQKKNNK